MKRKFIVFLLIFTVLFTGCGSTSGNQSAAPNNTNSTNSADNVSNNTGNAAGETDNNTADNNLSSDNDAYGEATIAFVSDKEATVTITSPAFERTFDDIADASSDDYYELYSWEVNFDSFGVDVYIPNMNKSSYSASDLRCSLKYLQVTGDDSYISWEIKSLGFSISEDTITIYAVLPEESEVTFIDGADSSEIASYTFPEAKSFTLSESQLNNTLYSREYSRDEITVTGSGDASSGTASGLSIFPDEVYANGFSPLAEDSLMFSPSTVNYVIYDGNQVDGGILAVDKKILLVLDAAGQVIDGYSRFGFYSGAESTSEGIKPTAADAEVTQSNSENYTQYGYSSSTTGELLQGEYSIYDNYLYLRWNQDALSTINTQYGYLSVADKLMDDPTDLLNRIDVADYGSNFSILYMSDFVLDDKAPVAGNYCNPEDFKYLAYVSPVTDDYYITEYEAYADIYSFDENGTILQDVYIEDCTSQSTYDYYISNGYQKVEGSDTLVYMIYDSNFSQSKYDILMNFKNFIQDYSVESYGQSMNDHGVAVYMSKPWSGN